MSQLPSGLSAPRASAVPVPRLGIQTSLAVPGLVAIPPVSNGLARATQLAEALGAVGSTAAVIGRDLRQERYEREREAAKVAALYEGQAMLDARTQAPELLAKIERREMLVPEGVSVTDYAQQLVDKALFDDDGQLVVPQAYADQYRAAVQPALAEAFTRQQQAIIDEAREENVLLLREAATGAADETSMRRAYDQSFIVDPDMPESERLAKIVVPALRHAAQAGDRKRFDAALGLLGDRFPDARLAAMSTLEETLLRHQAEVADRAEQSIDKLFVDGVPHELIRERVMESRQVLGETKTAQLLAQVDRSERQQLAEVQTQYADRLRVDIVNGRRPPQEIEQEIREAITQPHDSADHLDPSVGLSLLQTMQATLQKSASMGRVTARLRGEGVTLTSDDDKAIMQALAERGLLDENGTPTSPEFLAREIGQLGRVPNDIMQRINAGAQSSDPAELAKAAQLYWSLERVAPGAMAGASQLDKLAKARINEITTGLEKDSPAQIGADGKPNADFTKRVEELAGVAVSISRDEAELPPEKKIGRLFGPAGRQQQDAIYEAMRTALPAHLTREIIRDPIGFDSTLFIGLPLINRDRDFDIGEVPLAFEQQFAQKAAEYYGTLYNRGGKLPEAAKEEAYKLAIDDLKKDWIFVRTSPDRSSIFGRLRRVGESIGRGARTLGAALDPFEYIEPTPDSARDTVRVLRRYDNPADLEWTEQAQREWWTDLDTLRGNPPANRMKDLPPPDRRVAEDTDLDDWRPITLPGVIGFQFVHDTDPAIVLTDVSGRPIVWRPSTREELAVKEREAFGRKVEGAIRHNRERVVVQKMKLVEWALRERERRDAGEGYDRRLDAVDDRITEAHLRWYRFAAEEGLAKTLWVDGLLVPKDATEPPDGLLLQPEDKMRQIVPPNVNLGTLMVQ